MTSDGWILRLRPRNFAIVPESLARKGKVDLWWQTVPKFWFILLCYISFCITYNMSTAKFEMQQSQINQNFGTVCHTEDCLTFLRWGAKLLGTIAKVRGRSLKIQPSEVIRPPRPRKATVRIKNKCHWIIPFFPLMQKIASVFLCFFFWVSLDF
jgi:hypothetical protein